MHEGKTHTTARRAIFFDTLLHLLMMNRVMMCVAVLAAATLGDVAFDAVVDTEGTTVRFQHVDGEDRQAVVSEFCAKYVNASLAAECEKALLVQIEQIESLRRLPSVSLEIQVTTDGKTATFAHEEGRDIQLEASVFCAKYVLPDDVLRCAETIVVAARQQAALANMTLWEKLFGPELVAGNSGTVAVDEALGRKRHVAILFAADWCAPCRQFVPTLAALYNKFKKRSPDKLEVVWVSASRSATEARAFHGDMPWLAMAFSPERQAALQQAFGVVGFPTLLVLDSDGRLITEDGVRKVTGDPNGLGFPYRTPAQRVARLVRASLRFLRSVVAKVRHRPARRGSPERGRH